MEGYRLERLDAPSASTTGQRGRQTRRRREGDDASVLPRQWLA
jgi:hypothetical protein